MISEPMGHGRRPRGTGPSAGLCRAGCGRTTRDRKPYCEVHVERMPYARDAMDEVERIEAEASAVSRRGWRSVDVDGATARDMLGQLRALGPQPLKRLAINSDVFSSALAAPYVRALAEAGLVRVLTLGSRRGTPRRVVEITEVGVAVPLREIARRPPSREGPLDRAEDEDGDEDDPEQFRRQHRDLDLSIPAPDPSLTKRDCACGRRVRACTPGQLESVPVCKAPFFVGS